MKSVGWIAILFILMLFSAPADAQRIEFSAGITQYGSHEGVWYDPYSPYQNNLRQNTQMLSLSIPGWRAAVVHMGGLHNYAQWGPHELNVEQQSPSLPRCDGNHPDICWTGFGSGDVWGLSLGKTVDWGLLHGRLGLEGGAFLYHGWWEERYYAPGSQTAGYINTTDTHLTPYAAVNYRYGWALASFRYYHKVMDGLPGQMAKQVMVGMTFPLEGK